VVPQLEQVDVQRFIERFQTRSTTQGTPHNGEATKAQAAQKGQRAQSPVPDGSVELAEMRRKYERALKEKDAEIEKLRGVIFSIRNLIGSTENAPPAPTVSGKQATQRVDMWVEKLGRDTGAGRILQFLAQKTGLKFTRSQVALAIGMSAKGGAFQRYISTLRRNNLIIQSEGLLFVNPELLHGE
jgi:hypothetical protein